VIEGHNIRPQHQAGATGIPGIMKKMILRSQKRIQSKSTATVFKPIPNMSNRTILYVDDDPDDTELFCEVVREFHPEYAVKAANNGFEAIKQLHKGKSNHCLPCLIVMDINMPIFNGKDAMLQIKRDNQFRTIPIVMFTTSPKQPDDSIFVEQGVDIIQKPASYDMLKMVVEDLLSRCIETECS
jgi:CheY-like chemotaxis protein